MLAEEAASAIKLGLAWPDFDPRRADDADSLVRNIRARGYASVDGRFIPGLNAISVPILNWQDEAEAAVTLTSGDKSILDPSASAIPLLREVCAELSMMKTTA